MSKPLQVWIDATDPRSSLRVFGMTLLERQLRGLLEAGVPASRVDIEIPPDSGGGPPLPAELHRSLPLRFCEAAGPTAERLSRAYESTGGQALLALEAYTIVDSRLLRHLAERRGSLVGRSASARERAAVVRLEEPMPSARPDGDGLFALADAWVAARAIKNVPLGEIPSYLPRLRRTLPPHCLRVRDAADAVRVERFLFRSNYKGSTDFFTKYVYPPLVWRTVRWLAARRVHPNWISLLDVAITFGAIPLFATGRWLPGLVLAYAMTVLDSVDGKLARLTFRTSRLGHVLDHGLDVIHPPLWYAAWAWPLGGGHAEAAVVHSAIWMVCFYFLDRIVTQFFTWTTHKSIHAYTKLDVRMRTWISRRNINLAIFTLGLCAGAPVAAFEAIVVWQAITLVFHGARLGAVWFADPAGASGEAPVPREARSN